MEQTRVASDYDRKALAVQAGGSLVQAIMGSKIALQASRTAWTCLLARGLRLSSLWNVVLYLDSG
eukprot:scaffold331373_cov16-Prasinocladus_malaysianus.AAC.1